MYKVTPLCPRKVNLKRECVCVQEHVCINMHACKSVFRKKEKNFFFLYLKLSDYLWWWYSTVVLFPRLTKFFSSLPLACHVGVMFRDHLRCNSKIKYTKWNLFVVLQTKTLLDLCLKLQFLFQVSQMFDCNGWYRPPIPSTGFRAKTTELENLKQD